MAGSMKLPVREDLEIYDRVGGGDSFASGLIYVILSGKDPQWFGRMRSRARCARHDHSRRHYHGHTSGSAASHDLAYRQD